jgi:hypothetical protein
MFPLRMPLNFAVLLILCPCFRLGLGGTPSELQLTKINRNLITPPQFVYTGAQQYPTNQRDRWLEVETEFRAAGESSEEVSLNYLILINGTLLTGEVTHSAIRAGRENRSVMYVPPLILSRLTGDRTMTIGGVQNICVQIVQHGSIKDELSLGKAQPQWYATLPRVAGLLLNKNETPFAPLYWDRYLPIKTSH